MMIYHGTFLSPCKSFPKILFSNKCPSKTVRNPSSSFSLTPFPKVPFTNEEAASCFNENTIGAINEAAIGAIKTGRAPPSCFFISCSTVSVAPSINRPEYSSDFLILLISSLSSIKIIKFNPFHALTAPRPLIFLSNLSNVEEIVSVTNLGKTSLSEETARFISALLPNLSIVLPQNPPDLIILDN